MKILNNLFSLEKKNEMKQLHTSFSSVRVCLFSSSLTYFGENEKNRNDLQTRSEKLSHFSGNVSLLFYIFSQSLLFMRKSLT